MASSPRWTTFYDPLKLQRSSCCLHCDEQIGHIFYPWPRGQIFTRDAPADLHHCPHCKVSLHEKAKE